MVCAYALVIHLHFQDELGQYVRVLPQTVTDLVMEGQALTAFKMITHFQSSLIYAKNLDGASLESLNHLIVDQCVPKLLLQVMSQRCFDADLAYDLMMTMDIKKVLKYLEQVLSIYKFKVEKFETVARLAYRIFCHHKDKAKQGKVLDIILRCKWWKKLKNHPMTYENLFKSSISEVADKFIRYNALTENLLEEFCKDFKLDLQGLLITQLKFSLIYWKPNYTVKTDISGKRELHIDSKVMLSEKCNQIVAKIEDKGRLLETFSSLWPLVSISAK